MARTKAIRNPVQLFAQALCVVIVLTGAQGLSAQEHHGDYRVVLGSFLEQRNAEGLVRTLAHLGYDAESTSAEVLGRRFHRVYLAQHHRTRDEARVTLNHIVRNPAVHPRLGTDFWVLNLSPAVPSGAPLPQASRPEVSPELSERREQAATFSAVSNADIPLSPEQPYSVRLASYRSRSDAEQALAVPELSPHDPFLLRAYEAESGIRLDLLAGAFDQEDEAQALADGLEREGLGQPEMVSWVDVATAAAAYDALSIAERTEYLPPDPAWGAIPEELQPLLRTDLIPPGYRVRELVIMNQADPADFPESPSIRLIARHSGAGWSVAVELEHLLEDSKIEIQGFAVQSVTEDSWPATRTFPRDIGSFSPRDWMRSRGAVAGYHATSPDGEAWWYGFDSETRHAWVIRGSIDGLNRLLVGVDERSLFDSDTIRKTLALLPDHTNASLWAYSFGIVGEEYSRRRGNVEWAEAMLGHWSANIYAKTSETPFLVTAFDLNSSLQSSYVYGLYWERQIGQLLAAQPDEQSHALTVNDRNAFYVHSPSPLSRIPHEINLRQGSYVVAIGWMHDSTYGLDTMVEWAKRLRIWDDEL